MKIWLIAAASIVLAGCANKTNKLSDTAILDEGKAPIYYGEFDQLDQYPIPNQIDTETKDFSVLLPKKAQATSSNSEEFYEAGLATDGNQVALLRIAQSYDQVWDKIIKGINTQGFEVVNAEKAINEIVLFHPDWQPEDAGFWWQKDSIVLDLVTVSGATQISFWNQFDEVAEEQKSQQVIAALADLFDLNLEP